MNTRDALFKKVKRSKCPQDWLEAKQARNLVNRSINRAKAEHIGNILSQCDNNHKKMWKSIQKILPNKKSNSTITKIKNEQGLITGEGDQIAHTLNNFFGSIGQTLAVKINCQDSPNRIFPPVGEALSKIDYTTTDKVKKMIDDLSPYKTLGVHGFSAKLIKDSAQTIAPVLAHILNNCIDSCNIPEEWKLAKITPIYKDGCKTSPSNYRPISVLPFISNLWRKSSINQSNTTLKTMTF